MADAGVLDSMTAKIGNANRRPDKQEHVPNIEIGVSNNLNGDSRIQLDA